jgi:hypothetical protein
MDVWVGGFGLVPQLPRFVIPARVLDEDILEYSVRPETRHEVFLDRAVEHELQGPRIRVSHQSTTRLGLQ